MSKQVNTTINAPVVGDVWGGVVHVANTVTHQHTHQHSHSHTHKHTVHAHGPVVLQLPPAVQLPEPVFSLQAPPAPPARQGRRAAPKAPKRDVTPAQREVLALMHPLPKPVRVDVLIWMRVEFGTSLVLDLEPRELHQLRGQVLDVRRAHGI